MKKLFALLLALMMVFALAACGENTDNPGGNTDNPGTSQGGENNNGNLTTLPEINFQAIMMGNGATDVIWGKQDEATKQALIAEGKKDGLEISFGADDSMTVIDPENGDTIVQKPDGTWTIKSEDGSEGQYGGEWPENEFTKLLPKPDFTLVGASTNEEDFAVAFQNVTVEQIKAYVEKVKAEGFTVDAETSDQEVMGMVIYTYTAKNADGYTVTITFAMGTSGLTVEKP